MKKLFGILTVMVMVLALASPVMAASGQALADVGADWILGQAFHADAQVDTNLKLYCTDISPADTDIYATYTWCAGGGYADKTLTKGAGWVITTGNDPSDAIYTQQDYSFSGDLTTNTTIFGYCLTNAANTILIGCEALTSSFTPHNGYHLYITPKIKMSKGSAS